MSLDITTDFLLGSSVDSLSSPQVEFAEAFRIVQKTHNNMERQGSVYSGGSHSVLCANDLRRWLHHVIPKPGYKESLEIMNRFVHQYVDKVVEMSPTELKTKGSQSYNLLHELGNFTKDPKFLRDQIVSVLLAGRVCCTPSRLSRSQPAEETI